MQHVTRTWAAWRTECTRRTTRRRSTLFYGGNAAPAWRAGNGEAGCPAALPRRPGACATSGTPACAMRGGRDAFWKRDMAGSGRGMRRGWEASRYSGRAMVVRAGAHAAAAKWSVLVLLRRPITSSRRARSKRPREQEKRRWLHSDMDTCMGTHTMKKGYLGPRATAQQPSFLPTDDGVGIVRLRAHANRRSAAISAAHFLRRASSRAGMTSWARHDRLCPDCRARGLVTMSSTCRTGA